MSTKRRPVVVAVAAAAVVVVGNTMRFDRDSQRAARCRVAANANGSHVLDALRCVCVCVCVCVCGCHFGMTILC